MSDVVEINETPEDGQTLPCPACGRPLGPFVTECPACRARLDAAQHDALLREHRYSLGLGELMLIIGSVALVLGLARIAPGVSVFAGIVILVALIRTLGALHRARGWKIPMSTWDVLSLIAMSLGISLVIVISSTIAFFATCFPTGYASAVISDGSGIMIGVIAGVVIGLVAATWIARKLGKLLWMAGTPPKLQGIHFLGEASERPPASEPPAPKPEPPQ